MLGWSAPPSSLVSLEDIVKLSHLPSTLASIGLLVTLLSPGALAQRPTSTLEEDHWRALQQLADGTKSAVSRQAAAERRAAAEAERQLHERMADFVRAWNDFTEEYTTRGTFNLKKARAVNTAWGKLQHDENWPNR